MLSPMLCRTTDRRYMYIYITHSNGIIHTLLFVYPLVVYYRGTTYGTQEGGRAGHPPTPAHRVPARDPKPPPPPHKHFTSKATGPHFPQLRGAEG